MKPRHLTLQDRINISNGSYKFNPLTFELTEDSGSFITKNRGSSPQGPPPTETRPSASVSQSSMEPSQPNNPS